MTHSTKGSKEVRWTPKSARAKGPTRVYDAFAASIEDAKAGRILRLDIETLEERVTQDTIRETQDPK
jgi:hypothetical protein